MRISTRTCFAAMLTLGLALASLTAAGCNTAMNQNSPAVKLDRAMRGFHNSLVWQRYDDASAYVPAKQRSDFLEYYEAQGGEFHITDYEVNRLEISPNEEFAKAYVILSWYRLPSMSIQTTLMAETWNFRQESQSWEVVRQEAQPVSPMLR